MSNLELILNMLAEATATELSKGKNPQGFQESAEIAQQGDEIAGETRKQIEKKTGKPICTSERGVSLPLDGVTASDEKGD